MTKPHIAFICFVCIWLGAAIGANLIAAPAKFTVTALNTADLVSVGRVQFTYVGYMELVMGGLATACILIATKPRGLGYGVTIAAFIAAILIVLAQRFYIHPALISEPSAFLHRTYVSLEIIKVAALAVVLLFLARACS
ncbi:hypothetical protein D1224_14135 [Henriciella barbarensis]|uniref:DUF4149 domain-containing protein n=1 Tax=Henriciella barbarensis TaxID=86342 RepID=A0A399QT90_9PROT|nr:hypothetical protein [Henriciella barbarensis]RIJ20812.1 hypothetical protein D1224_14135 [Henriciella barbarensis]